MRLLRWTRQQQKPCQQCIQPCDQVSGKKRYAKLHALSLILSYYPLLTMLLTMAHQIATSSLEVAPHSTVVPQTSGLMRGMRPLSAQPRRRMSFGQLAAIPENRSLLTRNVERHQQQRQNRSSQGVSPTSGKNNSR